MNFIPTCMTSFSMILNYVQTVMPAFDSFHDTLGMERSSQLPKCFEVVESSHVTKLHPQNCLILMRSQLIVIIVITWPKYHFPQNSLNHFKHTAPLFRWKFISNEDPDRFNPTK